MPIWRLSAALTCALLITSCGPPPHPRERDTRDDPVHYSPALLWTVESTLLGATLELDGRSWLAVRDDSGAPLPLWPVPSPPSSPDDCLEAIPEDGTWWRFTGEDTYSNVDGADKVALQLDGERGTLWWRTEAGCFAREVVFERHDDALLNAWRAHDGLQFETRVRDAGVFSVDLAPVDGLEELEVDGQLITMRSASGEALLEIDLSDAALEDAAPDSEAAGTRALDIGLIVDEVDDWYLILDLAVDDATNSLQTRRLLRFDAQTGEYRARLATRSVQKTEAEAACAELAEREADVVEVVFPHARGQLVWRSAWSEERAYTTHCADGEAVCTSELRAANQSVSWRLESEGSSAQIAADDTLDEAQTSDCDALDALVIQTGGLESIAGEGRVTWRDGAGSLELAHDGESIALFEIADEGESCVGLDALSGAGSWFLFDGDEASVAWVLTAEAEHVYIVTSSLACEVDPPAARQDALMTTSIVEMSILSSAISDLDYDEVTDDLWATWEGEEVALLTPSYFEVSSALEGTLASGTFSGTYGEGDGQVLGSMTLGEDADGMPRVEVRFESQATYDDDGIRDQTLVITWSWDPLRETLYESSRQWTRNTNETCGPCCDVLSTLQIGERVSTPLEDGVLTHLTIESEETNMVWRCEDGDLLCTESETTVLEESAWTFTRGESTFVMHEALESDMLEGGTCEPSP